MTAHRHPLADIDMQAFVERITALRKLRGLTQARMAELLGMATRSYNRWERGGHSPSLEMLVKAADILQVSLDELVGRESISEPAIKNAELHQLVQEVDQLPDREQQAVIVMLDGLLRSAQVTRAVQRRGGGRTQRANR